MAERKTLARPYAKAIFNIAKSARLFSEWSELLQLLVVIVTDSKVQKLIKNQMISASSKAKFVVDVAGDNLQTKGANLVAVLAQHSRLELLPEIAEIFKDLQQEAEQQITVTVQAANKLAAEQEQELQASLNKKFNKTVVINFVEDKPLLAGVRIKAKDSVIDCSMHGQLEELRKVLKG